MQPDMPLAIRSDSPAADLMREGPPINGNVLFAYTDEIYRDETLGPFSYVKVSFDQDGQHHWWADVASKDNPLYVVNYVLLGRGPTSTMQSVSKEIAVVNTPKKRKSSGTGVDANAGETSTPAPSTTDRITVSLDTSAVDCGIVAMQFMNAGSTKADRQLLQSDCKIISDVGLRMLKLSAVDWHGGAITDYQGYCTKARAKLLEKFVSIHRPVPRDPVEPETKKTKKRKAMPIPTLPVYIDFHKL